MLLSHNEFPVLKDVKIKSKKAYTYFIISKFVRKRPQGEKKKGKDRRLGNSAGKLELVLKVGGIRTSRDA